MKLIMLFLFVLLHVNIAYSYLCPAPASDVICPNQEKIKYYLYTKNNYEYTEIFIGKLENVSLNSDCPLIFITHGFLEHGFIPWILKMVDQLFKIGCFNIVVVDWSAITSLTNYFELDQVINVVYPLTAFRTCCSGETVGALLTDLFQTLGISFSDMHLIGHSLGAHLFGCAGAYVTNKTGFKVDRISGMDAAGPCFNNISTDCRLHPGDAVFVDCIHTDITKFGYYYPLGHADYYPNGGAIQMGCPSTRYGEFPLSCSHCYAYALYSMSITEPGFISNICEDYVKYENGNCMNTTRSEMGFHASKDAQSVFYLDTTPDPLYAMYGQRRSSSITVPPIIG